MGDAVPTWQPGVGRGISKIQHRLYKRAEVYVRQRPAMETTAELSPGQTFADMDVS